MLLALLLAATAQPKLIAVLELQLKIKGDQIDRGFFADRIRHAALQSMPGARVMTRENMEVLARAHGTDLAACEGQCEVDTGRTLGADYVVSGELSRVGTQLAISLRLHDTAEGRVLAVEQGLGKDVDALLAATDLAVAALFKPLAPQAPASAAPAAVAPGSAVPPPALSRAGSGAPVAWSQTSSGKVEFALSSGSAHPGADLECRPLSEPSAELCRHECANDLRCLAFTYVPAHTASNKKDDPVCCLKSAVTAAANAVPGIIFGERRTPPPAPQAMFARQSHTNLVGGDFRHFPAPGPDACEKACASDLRCAAFTFVKEGKKPASECWLKSHVPGKSKPRAPCCVSGTKLSRS